MNLPSIIVLSVVILLAALAVAFRIRNRRARKKGGCSHNCSCSGCSGCCY